MKRNTSFLVSLVVSCLLGGCGWIKKEDTEASVTESAKNLAKNWKLMGSWTSTCYGSDILHAHARDFYKFEGDLFTHTTEYYLGASSCDGDPSVTQVYEGKFKLRKVNTDVENARNIDLVYKKSTLVSNTDAAADALNKMHFCGKSDYKKAIKENLSDKGDSVLCPLHRVPQKRFDLVKPDGDKLYFGYKATFGLSKSRPADLDRENVYIKK